MKFSIQLSGVNAQWFHLSTDFRPTQEEWREFKEIVDRLFWSIEAGDKEAAKRDAPQESDES